MRSFLYFSTVLVLILTTLSGSSFAKTIRLVSRQSGNYVYAVDPSVNIEYHWKTSHGTITRGQKTATVTIKSATMPTSVDVREIPLFDPYTVKPESFGARGNDAAEDSKALQACIDHLKSRGGGIVQFAAGQTYIIRNVIIYEGIWLKGSETTIRRPDRSNTFTRTISTDQNATYRGDSKPIRISGFAFDGNSKTQGKFRNFEQQQSHILYFTAGIKNHGSRETGRVKAFVENCSFRNGVADGISQYVNSDLTVRNCKAQNVFRGGYVCTGGNSIAVIKNFTTSATEIKTGIDVEVDGAGYGNDYSTHIWIDSSRIEDSDFDIRVMPGSTVLVTNSRVANPPLTLDSRDSRMLFKNCDLNFSAENSVGAGNYVLFPTELYFLQCRMTLVFSQTTCIGACLFVRNNSGNERFNPLYIHLDGCKFTVRNKPAGKKAYGLVYFRDGYTEKNTRIIARNVTFSTDYDVPFGNAILPNSGYCRVDFQSFRVESAAAVKDPLPSFYVNFGKYLAQ